LAPKSEQESAFIKDVISKFKNLDTTNIKDIVKLKQVVKQFSMIINQAWTKNAKNPSIPNNGGQRTAAILLITTDHQEVLRIRRNSRRLSKIPRGLFLTTKSKKFRIRVIVCGS